MKLQTNMTGPKLTGFNDIIKQIPAPAIKGLNA